MALKSDYWKPKVTYTITEDVCTLTPIQGTGCSFFAYEFFQVSSHTGWITGYWQDVLTPKGVFSKEPLCKLPFTRFEVLEQSEEMLVLRILKKRSLVRRSGKLPIEGSN